MEEYKRYSIEKDSLRLDISLASYDLSIKGHEGNELVIETDDTKKADKRLNIEFGEEEIEIREERDWKKTKGGKLALKLPKDKKYSGKCNSASGDIEIGDIFYKGKVSSASGNIALHSLKDKTEIEVKTASGDIETKNIEGKIETKSASGNIVLKDVILSELHAKTVSGDFEFSGKLSLEKNGSVKTVSGDIRLDIESGDNLCIYLKTMGDTNIKEQHREWKGEMKDWRRLMLKSLSGNIDVKSKEDLKNIYIESTKVMKSIKMKVLSKGLEEFLSRIPRGVKVKEDSSKEEHVSRILNMLESGKINAKEAKELIDSL